MNGKKNKLAFITILFFLNLYSQSQITGVVFSDKKQVVPFAVIEVTKKNGNSIYLYSDENGHFKIQTTISDILSLKFTSLGFYKNVLTFPIKNLINNELKVILKEKTQQLDEVVLRTKKPIIRKSDTIIFRTKYFTNATEQTVEELLKKIPGLQIDNEGTIKAR